MTGVEFFVPAGEDITECARVIAGTVPDGPVHVAIDVFVERPKSVAKRQPYPFRGRGLTRPGERVLKQLVQAGVLAIEGRACTVWLNRRFANDRFPPGIRVTVTPL